MKKFVALLLAMLLVLVNVAALAEGPDASDLDEKVEVVVRGSNVSATASTPTVTKAYTIESGLSFSETLNFTVACTGAPTGISTSDAPMITIGTNDTYTYAVGTDATDNIPISFPTYTVAGVYEYTITEKAGTVQGATTYDTSTINVKVYVVYDPDTKALTPTANVWIGDAEVEEQKTDTITNVYEVGDLKVTKEISGNLADPDREFEIEVTFTKEAAKTVMTDITVTTVSDGGTADKAKVTADDLNADAVTVTLTLKGDQYVTFENIPYGVTYTVIETDDTTHIAESAQANNINNPTAYTVTGEVTTATSISSASTEETITNTKNMEVPTGIALDTVPYILILAVAMLGVVLAARKREEY